MKVCLARLTMQNLQGLTFDETGVIEFEGESSKIPIFNVLFRRFPQAIHSRNASGETALHIASSAVRLDIVMRLVEVGIDVGIADDKGETAYDRISRQENPDRFDDRYPILRKRYLEETEKVEKFLRSSLPKTNLT